MLHLILNAVINLSHPIASAHRPWLQLDNRGFLFLDELLHAGSVHLTNVNRSFGVHGYGGWITEAVNPFQDLAILCVSDKQAVILSSIDDVNQVALDEQAPRRAEIRPLI